VRTASDLVDLGLEATVVLSFSRVGYEVRRRVGSWADPPPGAMDGQVAVVTGATSGMGLALATRFAQLGAKVVVVGRDLERMRAARDRIIRDTGAATVTTAACDLAYLDDVRALTEQLRLEHDRLDVLVHNAGALVHDFVRTSDGIELTVQTHVVSPFLLTAGLADLLAATPCARVLTVSSGGMYTASMTSLGLDPEGFDGTRAYALAKRAQVVLNEQWARRYPAVASFQAMHPGWVDTPGLRSSLPRFARIMGPGLRPPDQGIDTLVWLATTPPDANGGFWLDRRRRWTSKLPWTTTAPAAADHLWDWTLERSGAAMPGRPGAHAVAASADAGHASLEGPR
jgi:dehydrogenase/reductase SDR family member 12